MPQFFDSQRFSVVAFKKAYPKAGFKKAQEILSSLYGDIPRINGGELQKYSRKKEAPLRANGRAGVDAPKWKMKSKQRFASFLKKR